MVVTEAQLIEKGVELFKAYGYANVSVEMICSEFHVTKGSFYHHFKSKSELLLKWFIVLAEENDFQPDDHSLSSYEQLRTYYLNWGTFLESAGPDLLKEAHLAQMSQKEPIVPNLLSIEETPSSSSYIIPLIEQAQDNGCISSARTPAEMINICSYAVTGLIVNWGLKTTGISFLDEFMSIFDTVFELRETPKQM